MTSEPGQIPVAVANGVTPGSGVGAAAVMDGEKFLGLVTRSDVLNYLRRQVK